MVIKENVLFILRVCIVLSNYKTTYIGIHLHSLSKLLRSIKFSQDTTKKI